MFAIFFHTKYRDLFKILLLCVAWYVVSSTIGVVGKLVLSDFPYPLTVTLIQLISLVTYLFPLVKFLKSQIQLLPHGLSINFWLKMIFPLALGKLLSSVSSHISLWKVPVSYGHTVKASLPLFTVCLSRFIFKERQTYQVYFSLIPIILGVIVATVTEISFNSIGLFFSLLSTLCISLQNIYSKKCLREYNIHEFSLLFTLSLISLFFLFPFWLLSDFRLIINDTSLLNSSHLYRLLALLFIDGFFNFSQNIIAFTIIAMVTPLSYAVANCTKRIAIISVSLIVLGNPVTKANLFGMITAIFGVLLYNKAKYEQNKQKKKLPTLPTYEIYERTSLVQNYNYNNLLINKNIIF